MPVDTERVERTQHALQAAKLDALVCRLPENVVMLSGYWPMNGFAFLIFPVEKDPVLIAPLSEDGLARDSWVGDVRLFSWGLVDSGDPFEAIAQHLQEAAVDRDLKGARVGYEGSFEALAPPSVSAEPGACSGRTLGMIEAAFGDRTFDATDLIHALRATKTPREVGHLRTVNDIARMGLRTFFDQVVPGHTEIGIASAVEATVLTGGIGHKGVRVARAWASIMSGPGSAWAYKPYLPTTQRRLEGGDIALIELAVVADGWWADLTRTRVAGRTNSEQRERWQAVIDAQDAACSVMRAGVPARVVDRAARDVLAERGLARYFVHHTGHGLGLRYHEPEPFLHPAVEKPLAAGMVTSVEPGIYLPGWGGMRCEDDVLVTEEGIEVLSTFPRDLGER